MNAAINPTGNTFSLDDLKTLTDNDMHRVNQVITESLASHIVLINQLGQHIIFSGGKRLRPILLLLSARTCGYKGENDALLAAVIEFIHTATLLHDDVVDDSEMRRGQQTASHIWGNEAAVLVGDYLYSRAFQMMVRSQSMRIMDLLANATNTIAQGEVLQLLNINDPDTTEEKYLEVIYGKTACLFEAATQIGAILGSAEKSVEQGLANYGKHLGTAFQLVDDALDYTASSEELGKNVGDDLAEGKPTLPLIYALEHGNLEQKSLIRNAIKVGGIEHIDAITRIIKETGALDYTNRKARSEAEAAKSAIHLIPESDHKIALDFLADYAVERSH
jgi:octaprenyl-diphosphate synthase